MIFDWCVVLENGNMIWKKGTVLNVFGLAGKALRTKGLMGNKALRP